MTLSSQNAGFKAIYAILFFLNLLGEIYYQKLKVNVNELDIREILKLSYC